MQAPLLLSRLCSPALLTSCTQAAWLINLVGMEMAMPKESDDPNAVCASILSSCKKLGFASPAYHPSKLTVSLQNPYITLFACVKGEIPLVLSHLCVNSWQDILLALCTASCLAQ